MNFEVVLLALGASLFTALASVAQRRAAAPAPGEFSLSIRLIGYLLRRPMWFLGIGAMILGFAFQVDALKVGSLSVVQPVVATELVIVFAFIALKDRHRVHARDWIAAVGMVVGLGAFLSIARPQGGGAHAGGAHWLVAGVAAFALAAIATAFAYHPALGLGPTSSNRRAALLGIAAAAGFGFVAAVVKELSTHLHQGVGVFLTWSPYVLLLSGAASMFLASNAFQSGSLAASQPGLTLVDPLVASVLGVVLFGERVNTHPLAAVGEVLAVLVIVSAVITLSRSPLIEEREHEPLANETLATTSPLESSTPAETSRTQHLVRGSTPTWTGPTEGGRHGSDHRPSHHVVTSYRERQYGQARPSLRGSAKSSTCSSKQV
jgi:drug/metabolite transporter (DMT)-like permease